MGLGFKEKVYHQRGANFAMSWTLKRECSLTLSKPSRGSCKKDKLSKRQDSFLGAAVRLRWKSLSLSVISYEVF